LITERRAKVEETQTHTSDEKEQGLREEKAEINRR